MLAKFSALRKLKGRGMHSWVVDTIALGPVVYIINTAHPHDQKAQGYTGETVTPVLPERSQHIDLTSISTVSPWSHGLGSK